MINSSAFIGGKFIWKKNPLHDLLSSLNSVILTNERNGILTDEARLQLVNIFKGCYRSDDRL